MIQFAEDTSDTLTPESFDSAIEQPQIILATDEAWPEVEGYLGERSLGN